MAFLNRKFPTRQRSTADIHEKQRKRCSSTNRKYSCSPSEWRQFQSGPTLKIFDVLSTIFLSHESSTMTCDFVTLSIIHCSSEFSILRNTRDELPNEYNVSVIFTINCHSFNHSSSQWLAIFDPCIYIMYKRKKFMEYISRISKETLSLLFPFCTHQHSNNNVANMMFTTALIDENTQSSLLMCHLSVSVLHKCILAMY